MKDNNNRQTTTASIGFLDLLAIVFIVMKLLGKITWSWWWVLAPIWIPVAVLIAIFFGALNHCGDCRDCIIVELPLFE